MTEPAIEVEAVSRTFGRGRDAVRALDEVSLSVAYGETVALLGSNGAGKTTLIKILSTLLLPSVGTARIAGVDVVRDPRAVRAVTSVVFGGDRGLYLRLSGLENLRFFAMLGGLGWAERRDRIERALERVNLADARNRRVETYSKGMRQRLHLAIGLVVQPKVLLLDEPTAGLDPVEAERLRETVLGLRDDGVAILLTSHYLLDVERLANRVLLLAGGRIRENLTLAEFVRKSGHAATVSIRGRGDLPEVGATLLGRSILSSQLSGDTAGWHLDLRVREWSGEVFDHLRAICATAHIDEVDVREMRLEEAFAAISSKQP